LHPTNYELTFQDLRNANARRQLEWDDGNTLDLTYYGNALAGEVGELCNVIKKLERERLGLKGSRAAPVDLGKEAADVLIYLDLLMLRAGQRLDLSTIAKFNETSAKLGFKTCL
jgi:NTP pyrophosphatase (non-canonical NTP hydrolase)